MSKYKVNINAEIIQIKGKFVSFKDLCFPVKIHDIIIFEKNNQHISVNVFGFDTEKELIVGPYYKTLSKKTKHINLLFLQESRGGNIVSHYVWIKDISRYVII